MIVYSLSIVMAQHRTYIDLVIAGITVEGSTRIVRVVELIVIL